MEPIGFREFCVRVRPEHHLSDSSEGGSSAAWHPGCFRCSNCSEHLVDFAYAWLNGKPYCLRHYGQMIRPRCATCDHVSSPSILHSLFSWASTPHTRLTIFNFSLVLSANSRICDCTEQIGFSKRLISTRIRKGHRHKRILIGCFYSVILLVARAVCDSHPAHVGQLERCGARAGIGIRFTWVWWHACFRVCHRGDDTRARTHTHTTVHKIPTDTFAASVVVPQAFLPLISPSRLARALSHWT